MNLAYSVEQSYQELIDRAETYFLDRIDKLDETIANAEERGKKVPESYNATIRLMEQWIDDLKVLRVRELAESIHEVDAVRRVNASARARITLIPFPTAEGSANV